MFSAMRLRPRRAMHYRFHSAITQMSLSVLDHDLSRALGR